MRIHLAPLGPARPWVVPARLRPASIGPARPRSVSVGLSRGVTWLLLQLTKAIGPSRVIAVCQVRDCGVSGTYLARVISS